jgi:predicted type IV restriction endonuclease
MDLSESIRDLQIHIKKQISQLEKISNPEIGEQATKNALILPFLHALGYDIHNLSELRPEHPAHFGDKGAEKIDYAILKDNKPIILIECKAYGKALGDNEIAQIQKYFASIVSHLSEDENPFVILTDGNIYKFYTDLEKKHVLDREPYLELNILNIKDPKNDTNIAELKYFANTADIRNARMRAQNLRYIKNIKNIFISINESPTEKIVDSFLDMLNLKPKGKYKELFKGLIKETFEQFIASTNGSINQSQAKDEITNEKLEAFYIIKSLTCDEAGRDKIVTKSSDNSFDFLYGDTLQKTLCRLYLNSHPKTIGIFNESGKEDIHEINSVDDINNYGDQIISQLPGIDSPWIHEDLIEYLKGSAPYQRLFLGALAQAGAKPVTKSLAITLMSQIAVSKSIKNIKDVIGGRDIAGATSGLTKKARQWGNEGIIMSSYSKDDKDYVYEIKNDYKQIVINWAKDESII